MKQPAVVIIAIDPNGTWEGNMMHDGNVHADHIVRALNAMCRDIIREGLPVVQKQTPDYKGKHFNRHEENE